MQAEVDTLGTHEHLIKRKAKVQDEIKTNKEKLRKLVGDQRSIEAEKRSLDVTIGNLEREIASEEARMATHTQARKEENDRKIHEAQTAIDDGKAERERIREQLADEQNKTTEARAKGGEIENRRYGIQKEIQNSESMIAHARRAVDDTFAPYGNNMKALYQRIQSYQHWKGDTPLGPLGIYIKAKEPGKWGDLLRHQLGGFLMSFAVTDSNDRQVLKKMLDESKKYVSCLFVLHAEANMPTRSFNNNIIISQKDMFEYSHGEPSQQYLTVLRALDV